MEAISITSLIDLIIYIIKGIIIGIVASAPMGPVGILCIRRTIKKGRVYGLATGAGAALSDVFYALITGFGLSLFDFVQDEQNAFYMKLCGSVMLAIFGVYMYRTKHSKTGHPESNKKGSLVHNFLTALAITLANPLIIFLFLALFNMMAPFAGTGNFVEMTAGYLSIIGGAMLWWFGLTYVIDRMRTNFTEQGIRTMNRTIGAVVLTIAIIYALLTLFKISFVIL